MNDLEEQAEDVEHQGHAIEDEDGRATLVAVRQKQQQHEEHDRGAELGAVVDAEADVILVEPVDIPQRGIDLYTLRSPEGDILGVRVEVGGHDPGHLGGVGIEDDNDDAGLDAGLGRER